MQYTQHTLKHEHVFEGKGLHTGAFARMVVKPAPAGYGIRFRRTDRGADNSILIPALAENVVSTARSTSIGCEGVSVTTVEHLLSALTGMGIDNAEIELNNIEVPILDGSARFYVEAFKEDGLVDQDAPRRFVTVPETIEVKDEKTGSWVRIEPAEEPSATITVDFNSRVLGIQEASWNPGTDYAKEIGVCRTFVFFHEIEFLFKNGLIKGGDVDNAIVIVEHPVTDGQLESLAHLFGKKALKITESGYLNNLKLHFENECGRHKLLDLMGDLRLTGGFLNAHITAFKPGHTINTQAALAVRQLLK